MKVQKTISLTPATAAIADNMDNFSQWIRISLRAYQDNMSVGAKVTKRIKWAQCAQYLASYISDNTETFNDLEPHQIIALAMNHANKQLSLEEFE